MKTEKLTCHTEFGVIEFDIDKTAKNKDEYQIHIGRDIPENMIKISKVVIGLCLFLLVISLMTL